MEPFTVSSCILALHKEFAAYTTQRLQELGLSFGLIYFVIYVGKHPDCTPSELTKDLHLDWGHSQRSLNKLAEDGFLTKEKNGRSYHLKLTQRDRNDWFDHQHSIVPHLRQCPNRYYAHHGADSHEYGH